LDIGYVQEIVNEKMSENKYHLSNSKIVLDEGKYVCIPVRKNVQYMQNEEMITTPLESLTLYSGHYENYLPSHKELSWENNPFNRYDFIRNGDLLTDRCYIVFDINEGDSCTIKDVRRSTETNLERVFDSCGTNLPIGFPTLVPIYNISVYGKKLESGVVYFKSTEHINNSYKGNYGFDEYEERFLRAFEEKYEHFNIRKDNGKNIKYMVPNLSMWTNMEVSLNAILKKEADTDSVYYEFEGSGLEINGQNRFIYTGKDDICLLRIRCNIPTETTVKTSLTVKDKTGKTVGKMNVYYQDKPVGSTNYRVVAVTLGNDANAQAEMVSLDNYKAGGELELFFNNQAFNQALVQLQYSEERRNPFIETIHISDDELRQSNVRINPQTNRLEGDDGNQSNLVVFLNTKVTDRDPNERIIYLICNRDMENTEGFAFTRTENGESTYSVMMFKSYLNLWSTFVHEMGHTFGLRHPFDNPKYKKGDTSNFMDYRFHKDMFWRSQWSIINKEIKK